MFSQCNIPQQYSHTVEIVHIHELLSWRSPRPPFHHASGLQERGHHLFDVINRERDVHAAYITRARPQVRALCRCEILKQPARRSGGLISLRTAQRAYNITYSMRCPPGASSIAMRSAAPRTPVIQCASSPSDCVRYASLQPMTFANDYCRESR